MKTKKSIVAVFMLVVLVIANLTVIPVSASTFETEEVANVKEVIDLFFSNYYLGIENTNETYSESVDRIQDLLIETDSTLQFLAYYKWNKAFLDEFGLNYQNCVLDIDYAEILIQENTASVELNFNMTYNYSFSPETESAIYRILYDFTLIVENGKWKISEIETDLMDYTRFQDELEAYIKPTSKELMPYDGKDARVTFAKEAIDDFTNKKLTDIELIKQQAVDSVAASAHLTGTSIVPSNNTNNSTRSTYSYDASNAAYYAMFYAEAPEDDRLFYTASGGDCTNFVSQCVWAAYGGFTTYAESLTNIAAKIRMDRNEWYGGLMGGGGSPAWESVEQFYSYVTRSKTYGPNGTGINNNKLWSRYPNYSGSIPVGTVLQLREGSSGNYEHSVYVTKIESSTATDATYGYFNRVLCSYHSNDHYNKSLMEVIIGFGGSNCYMRGISFSSANFES